ncbi:hypothetical protein M2405_004127 [Rhodococcus erythropolis]|uniref:hypothetical protein n=1 Tax=Rhodococcus erythropolis TaxID=1833 RepID=UPI00216A0E5E|nr:hypothetical protein [Rhodococcus erythropolis]MCS4255824.1 hypothetical protein [Rhodococcus erythropolis]MCW2425341.1 hypothetical protein [Rhodococcus erythropolis]
MKKALAALVLSATVLVPAVAGCSNESVSSAISESDTQSYRGTEFVSEPKEVGPPKWSVVKPDGWTPGGMTLPGIDDILTLHTPKTAIALGTMYFAGFSAKNAPDPDLSAADFLQMEVDAMTAPASGTDRITRPTTVGGYEAMIIESRQEQFEGVWSRLKSTGVVVPRTDGRGLAIIVLTTSTSDEADQKLIDDVEQLHSTIKIL